MLLKCANSCRVSQWSADTVDEILIGDAMCVKAFVDNTIPDTETLSLTYLPDRVHWSMMNADPIKPNQFMPTACENKMFIHVSFNVLAVVFNTVIVAKSHVFCSISHTILHISSLLRLYLIIIKMSLA